MKSVCFLLKSDQLSIRQLSFRFLLLKKQPQGPYETGKGSEIFFFNKDHF